AGNDRRRHAGAAQTEVAVADRRGLARAAWSRDVAERNLRTRQEPGDFHRLVLQVERAALSEQRDHAVARSNDVRLHHVVDQGRTLRAVAGNLVVQTGRSVTSIGRAHGENEW